MTINNLTISHLSGNIISAANHTLQTSRINTVIETIEEHSDLAFYEYDLCNELIYTHGGTYGWQISPATSESKMLGYDFEGLHITEVYLKQRCHVHAESIRTQTPLTKFWLREYDDTAHEIVDFDFSASPDSVYFFVQNESGIYDNGTLYNEFYIFYRIPLGLYRCKADKHVYLEIGIHNPDPVDTMEIKTIRIYGYK